MKWFPESEEVRKIVRKVFPLFYVDARRIDIHNWDYIWDVVSDLSKRKADISDAEYKEKFDEFLRSLYGDKYSKIIKIIDSKLSDGDFGINQFNFKNHYKSILGARMGGTEFLKNEKGLVYYSDGLNAYNYVKLILHLIPELADTGWKDPIIIIDEIEMGLHPQYIFDLVECLNEYKNGSSNLVISTHSPMMIASMIKKTINVDIYRVYENSNYTETEKMKDFIETKYKRMISTNEAVCYFSEAVLIMEGTSDLELLSNHNINKLFDKLNSVYMYPYNSNNPVLKLSNPSTFNLTVPFILLVDMDKILKYKSKNGYNNFKYNVDKLVNPFVDEDISVREKLYFDARKKGDYSKEWRYNLKRYLNKIFDKTTINSSSPKYYIQDEIYSRIISYVKTYCMLHNVYPVRTTIEGVIVNEKSFEIFYTWLKENYEIDFSMIDSLLSKDQEWSQSIDRKYRALILRLIFQGKFDHLKTLEENDSFEYTEEIKSLIGVIGKKTSGWVTNFIDYFFENKISDDDPIDKKKEIFKNYFPELNHLLNIVENMVK